MEAPQRYFLLIDIFSFAVFDNWYLKFYSWVFFISHLLLASERSKRVVFNGNP